MPAELLQRLANALPRDNLDLRLCDLRQPLDSSDVGGDALALDGVVEDRMQEPMTMPYRLRTERAASLPS
jgi:hypothetical protein